jgi:hypothetical protein
LLSKFIKIKIHRNIIQPAVLYGCETWSLIFREKHKLRVFESRGLMRIFGPKRGKVTGEWSNLHNDKLNDLYSSPNIVWVIKSNKMKWVGHLAHMWESRGVYRIWWGILRDRDHLGDPSVDGKITLR